MHLGAQAQQGLVVVDEHRDAGQQVLLVGQRVEQAGHDPRLIGRAESLARLVERCDDPADPGDGCADVGFDLAAFERSLLDN